MDFCDTRLSFEARAADIVKRIPLRDAPELLGTNSDGVPSLSIPPHSYGTEGTVCRPILDRFPRNFSRVDCMPPYFGPPPVHFSRVDCMPPYFGPPPTQFLACCRQRSVCTDALRSGFSAQHDAPSRAVCHVYSVSAEAVYDE